MPRRNVRGLLYYLAVQPKPVSRAQLCLLFWPDIPEADARRNLTRLLTHLRMALPHHETLIVSEGRVSLDQQYLWCDVVELRRLASGQRSTHVWQLCSELYAGPFLAGFYLPDCPEYDVWLSQEQADLETLYLAALSGLIEHRTAVQDYAGAIGYAQRYLEIDCLAEEVHRRLITLYTLSGDRGRAIRQYEQCIMVLESELGTKPLPETQAVYQAVLEGRQPGWISESVDPVYPANLKSLRLDIPMVGRSKPIHKLIQLQQGIRTGSAKVILISGEAGIGKSRLLYEFSKHSQFKNRVLFGAGQPAERTVPYHPIVEALRPISVRLTSLPPLWLAEVTRVLPELRDQYPGLPSPFALKGEEARLRLFDALCRYVFSLQEELGPVLLCLDDLHWFDKTSLGWIVHLCSQIQAGNIPIMVVGAYRTDDKDQVQVLRHNLARMGILEEIELSGLYTADICELFRSFSGLIPDSQSLARRLQEATGGNPFFVLAILQSLTEEERLAEEAPDLAVLPLPESVREAVSHRIERLNPRCRQVLEAGAVLGGSFGFKALQLTAGRNELETSHSVDVLTSRRMFQEENGRYRFQHDLIYRVTLAGISPLRLGILHQRAGRALEKLEPDNAAILARHFEAGGVWHKALHYYQLSACKAEALFAWQEAEAHLEQMIALLELEDRFVDQGDRLNHQFETLKKLSQIHYVQGKVAERDADLHRLEKIVDISGDLGLRLQVFELRVNQLNEDAQYLDSIAEARRGLVLVSSKPDTAIRGRLLAQIGFAHLLLGEVHHALPALQEAQSCLVISSDLELRSAVLNKLALVQRIIGDHERALAYYKEAYTCDQERGDPYSFVRFADIGFMLTNLSRFEEAKQFLDECLAFARKAGVRTYEGQALLALGGWHLYRGDPVNAIQTLKRALTILETMRSHDLTVGARISIGFSYYHLANLECARNWLEDGIAFSQLIGHKNRVALALPLLALVEIAAGCLSKAKEALQEGLTIARALQSKELTLASLIACSRLERLSASPSLAKEHAVEGLLGARKLKLGGLEVWAGMEAGLALADLGELEPALSFTREAVASIPWSHQLWVGSEYVHLAHAWVLRLSGELDAAYNQECLAAQTYRDKAASIPDPKQRRQLQDAFEREYLKLSHPRDPLT